jgi:Zn-finger nucleic acid-binding protein
MQCPVDQTTLAMTDRQGIEIDYCPKCRGVWLDRGELDKLIAAGSPDVNDRDRDADSRRFQNSKPYSDDRAYGSGKKRKKSFLGDLFDFD